MSVTVSTFTEADVTDYVEFLARRPDGLLYASLSYRSFLVDLLGCEAPYLIARDHNSGFAGVLPVMLRNGAYGRVINSLPFYGSHGGVLAASSEVSGRLMAAFDDMASATGTAVSVWIDHPFAPSGEQPVKSTHHDIRISQITDLPPPALASDIVATSIDGSARRNFNKSRREGVTVRVANDEMDFLEGTHRQNMASIGGNAKSHDFFAKIPRHFAPEQDYRIWLAERDGRPLAALLVFYFNETVEYFVPTTVEEARELQPMAAILEAAMTDAARRGFRRWNWGGTWTSQDGVRRFKSKWGAVDRRYLYHIRVTNPALLGAKPRDLIEEYPGFFTVPFAILSQGERNHG